MHKAVIQILYSYYSIISDLRKQQFCVKIMCRERTPARSKNYHIFRQHNLPNFKYLCYNDIMINRLSF